MSLDNRKYNHKSTLLYANIVPIKWSAIGIRLHTMQGDLF